jgi:hypothetical protein
MATGYFAEGFCWATTQEATDAHFQSIPPTILTTTTTQSIAEFVRQASGVWNMTHATQNATGVRTQQYSVAYPQPTFTVCQLPNSPSQSFQDGLLLGWGIVLAMALAYAYKSMGKAL